MESNNPTFRIVCISDTHNLTDNLKIPEAEVLIHAGDLTKIGTPENLAHAESWLRSLPHPIKIVIGGNHDMTLDLENYSKNLYYRVT
jgi:3',5'-cyclic AMP phosphodiesterase CpdA